MIQSLTAALDLDKDDLPDPFPGLWSIQLRSLNRRFFELNCAVPNFISELEVPLRKLLQQHLIRGHIECRLGYKAWHDERVWNSALVPKEVQQLLALQQEAKNNGLLLEAPNSLQFLQYLSQAEDKSVPLNKAFKAEILEFCEEACRQLVAKRKLEGAEIYHELLGLHQSFVEQCHLACRYEEQIPDYYQKQLEDKYRHFQQRLKGQAEELDSSRLLAELSLFLAKGDVREELCRLEIHAQRCFDVLNQASEPCAKEIDFLLQEMNREANTLASKSPIVELQQIAVKLKVIIEQMREQAKNIL